MWHTVFIKNEDFILYESEKAVKIKIPLKGAHYIWLPKKLVKFEKFRHEYMTHQKKRKWTIFFGYVHFQLNN